VQRRPNDGDVGVAGVEPAVRCGEVVLDQLEADVRIVLGERAQDRGDMVDGRRTGAMWASDYYDIEPDVLVFGKGVGGGFPLAGVLAKRRFAKFLAGDDQLTFGQFPISIAAGLATVRAVIADDLCTTAAEHGRYATERLLQMQRRHPLIGDVRSPGLMVSIELVRDRATKEPATAEAHAVFVKAQERGVILGESRYAGLGNLIKIKPPLDISRELLARSLHVLDDVLTEVEAEYGTAGVS
jgi:4-aminobutyrate aminotransferase/4-aminobutyrate aminotransferase/(S)-3-amino-2-methylpropionate transaminase